MKKIGIVLVAIGAGMFVYFMYVLLSSHETFHSPVPQTNGIKVIFITPAK